MRTVIFDLDGTLADTASDLLAAANAAFAASGLPAPLTAADAATAMQGGRAMLRLGAARLGAEWDEPTIALQHAVLLDAYAGAIAVHTRMFPGAVAAVEALRAGGIATGICTNKPAWLAERLLADLGVRGLFASLVGGDTLPLRKPDPAPLRLALARAGGPAARGLMVGDTRTDHDTARAACIPVALVTFGPAAESVAALAPDALLHRFDALPDIVARLLR